MSAKLERALERLKGILPLKARQSACDKRIRALHRQVLRSFVSRGRILSRAEMAQQVADVEAAIRILKDCEMVVFTEAGEPVGAYPFTMEAREHKVRVNGHEVHAMCALDALAIGPMFGMRTQIDSRCGHSGLPVHIRQSGKTIENQVEAGGLYLGIAWGAAAAHASCADSLCRQMPFLRERDIAERWLGDGSGGREIFTLPEAVEFASRLFVPLMGRTAGRRAGMA